MIPHLPLALAGATAAVIAIAPPAQAQYPTEPPAPAPLRPLQLPPFAEVTLANGLQIVVVENHELPLVSVSLTMPGGSSYDPPGREGLADLVADLMLKGTESHSAEDLAAEIEGVGSAMNAAAGNDFFTLSTTVLREHVDVAFRLMGDVLQNATFPDQEVELTRTRMLSALRAQEAQPGFLAAVNFNAALYGDHPYGRTATSATVERLARADVVEFAGARLRPGGAVLVVAGDLTPDDARRLADEYLGSWSGTAVDDRPSAVPTAQPTEIILVNRPGSAQSNILIGNLTMRPGDADYYAAVVATKVLGGGTDARLFLTLREEKGWTYGAYASHNRPQGVARFRANTEVRTEVTDSALAEILYQVRRMRTEPVSGEELEAAQGFLVGSFPLRIQTPQQIAGQVRTVRLLGLGDDYLRTYRDRLAAVDADDIVEVTGRLMQPDSSVIVVVGDGPAIYEGLTALAPVRIIDAEGNPLTPADLAPTATALEVDPSLVVARRDSFQVMVQGQPFGAQIATVTREGGQIRFQEDMGIPMAGMSQRTTVLLDAATLDVQSVDQSMAAGGMEGTMALRFEAGRVVGTGALPNPMAPGELRDIAIDREIVAGMTESNALQVLIPTLRLEVGARHTVMVLDGGQGTVQPYTIAVKGVETVTVAAGTFETYRVEISGGPAVTEFFITRDDRRLVRITIVGQPLSMDLAESR